MKSLHKRVLILLLSMVLCFICDLGNLTTAHAAKENSYIVLVQHKNGSWTAHYNLVEVSQYGCLMLKAKRISKALGFTYKIRKDGTFAIKRSYGVYNIYIKEKKEYQYDNGTINMVLSAANKAYLSRKSGNNLCCIDSLKGLVNIKCFNKTAAKEYSDYAGIICLSAYEEIPDSVPIVDVNQEKKPSPTPIPKPSSVMIEGVEFPVRDQFLASGKTLADWGGTANLWTELQQNLNGQILDSTVLWFDSEEIGFSHQGVGFEGIKLSKTKKGYQISINVKLSGSVLSNQNASVLKAIITTISSRPTIVYEAVYDSFTSTSTHGINKESYADVGDCKIKIGIKDGTVTYYIKEK